MNIQAKYTELRKASVSALRVISQLQKQIDKLNHAGCQLVRYGDVVCTDDRQSIEYTHGVDEEWYQAINQWRLSGGKMPEGWRQDKAPRMNPYTGRLDE